MVILFLCCLALLGFSFPTIVQHLPRHRHLDWLHFSAIDSIEHFCVLSHENDCASFLTVDLPPFVPPPLQRINTTYDPPYLGKTYPTQYHVAVLNNTTAFREGTIYNEEWEFLNAIGCNRDPRSFRTYRAVQFVDCAISLSDRWSDNFGHMVDEQIGRLFQIPASIRDKCHVLVDRNEHYKNGDFDARLLHLLFGIPRARILETTRPIQATTMYVPGTGHCAVTNCVLLSAARENAALHNEFLRYPPALRDRTVLFLVREEGNKVGLSSRQLQNDALLRQIVRHEAQLVGRQYVEVTPGVGAMEFTARAVARATLIVALHGAAMGNVVFAPRNATLIEILPTDRTGKMEPLHGNLAYCLGLSYHNVLATPVDDQPGLWYTDPNVFRAHVRDALAQYH